MMPTMWTCEYLETVDSTQREAFRRLQSGGDADDGPAANARRPFAIWTLRQTDGMGRHGRRWQDSPRGGLAMTLVWPQDDESSRDGSSLPARLSLAVLHVLERRYAVLAHRLGLKWPNDIVAQDAKLAGVLVARHVVRSQCWWVAGIGINLAWDRPPLLDRPVTDLRALGVADADPEELVREVCADVDRLWRGDLFAEHWEDEFMKRDTYAGCAVVVVDPMTGSVLHQGLHQGICPTGELLLAGPQSVQRIGVGELSLRRASA